eukprot:975820-Pyramimonas_sp.AAC.1
MAPSIQRFRRDHKHFPKRSTALASCPFLLALTPDGKFPRDATGFQWISLDSSGFRRTPLEYDSMGLHWTPLGSVGLNWSPLDSI